jgi:diadenosine tetraphosphatase ApaH/serine/threonine PP2A family protein phosphatase
MVTTATKGMANRESSNHARCAWRPLAAPMPDASDRELLDTYNDLKAAIVVYGHIHRPYVRYLPSLTVANAGSVGLPYDGDTRASYVLIDSGKPNIRRIEYDLEREVVTLLGSGYPRAHWLAEILRRGRYIAP